MLVRHSGLDALKLLNASKGFAKLIAPLYANAFADVCHTLDLISLAHHACYLEKE